MGNDINIQSQSFFFLAYLFNASGTSTYMYASVSFKARSVQNRLAVSGGAYNFLLAFLPKKGAIQHHFLTPITPSGGKREQRRCLRLEPERKMATAPPFNQLVYYTARTPNGIKPTLLLEELGIKYKVEGIDIMKNTQKEPWFLEINPNGRIPALKDGDMRIFESGAIMLYLHDHYDPEKRFGYENGTALYYEMLSWLMFQMGGIGPMQGLSSSRFNLRFSRVDRSQQDKPITSE